MPKNVPTEEVEITIVLTVPENTPDSEVLATLNLMPFPARLGTIAKGISERNNRHVR